MSNVSCVLFHGISPDVVLSSSEEGSILVWDICKRTRVEIIHREHCRFSILASHPAMLNRFAAGHESGILVFKLASERPVLSVSGDSMCRYFNTAFGFHFELSNFQNRRYSLINLVARQRHYWDYCPCFYQHAKMLSHSSAENAVLLCFDVDGGSYQLYIIPEDFRSSTDMRLQDSGKESGGWAVFVAGDRFAVLDKRTNQILVKNLKNETVEKIVLPSLTDAIFYAGTKKLLCRAEDRVFILDLEHRIILGELQTRLVIKRVFCSKDMEFLALLSKNSVVVASKELVHQCTLHETTRVKKRRLG